MLDNAGQVKAFQILYQSGLITPATITLARTAATNAKASATALKALVLPETVYPPTVSAYTTSISEFANQLVTTETAATALADSLSPHVTPSDLLQMKLGWECYAKGNGIEPIPAFPLVEGMGNIDVPQSLVNALAALALDAVTKAMNAVNTKLGSGGTPEGGASGGANVPPVITDAEVKALKSAVDAMAAPMGVISTDTNKVNTLAGNINSSTAQAAQALSTAVNITLAGNMAGDPILSPAISLIMPDGVLDALKEV